MKIIRLIRDEPSYRLFYEGLIIELTLLYEELIIELTPEQRANTRVYHNATHDIRYDRLSTHVGYWCWMWIIATLEAELGMSLLLSS